MKEKILKILKEYYDEAKIYYYKINKKIRKIYRTIRYHLITPDSKFRLKISAIINNIILKIKLIINQIKITFQNTTKRQKILIGSAAGVLVLLLLVLMPSFAIYQNEFEFQILGGIVGNPNNYDYTLLIYVEDMGDSGVGNNEYNLVESVPTFGYVYSGYNCKNNSTLTYDEETKLTTVVTDKKDICSIYFDLKNTADVTVKIMLENMPESNTYTKSNVIPYFGYRYSHYECDNNSVLKYDEELHKASIETNGQDYCNIYFQKEKTDIQVGLYIENAYQSGKYTEMNTIPSNKLYEINSDKSECMNESNERIETEIGYNNGYVEITSNEIAYCKVYLDLTNE